MMLELMDILLEETRQPGVGRQALVGRLYDSQCALSVAKGTICDGTRLHARAIWVQCYNCRYSGPYLQCCRRQLIADLAPVCIEL